MIEVELPDGTIAEFPDGTPPETIKSVLGKRFGKPAPERSTWDAIKDNVVGNPDDGVQSYGEQLGTWLNRAGESMTLGVVGDEASAAAYGALPGRSYEGELSRFRGNEAGMSTMGRLSADLAGAVVPAMAGVGIVASAPTLAGRVATGAGLGAGAGAVQGYAEGEGGVANRLQGGAVGGMIGGALGGAIPVVAEAGRGIVRGGKEFLAKRRIGAEAARALGIDPRTGRVLSEILATQDEEAMREALRRAGPDAMLAEGSPGLAGYLDEAVNSNGRAANIVYPRVNSAVADRMGRATNALDYTMGVPSGMKGAQETIRSSTAAQRKQLYDAAYDTAIDWRAPGGEELRFDLQNLPPGIVAKVRELRDFAPQQFQSKPISAYAGEFADDVATRSGATVDEAARIAGLDEALAAGRAATRETGGKRPFTNFIATSGGIDPRGTAAKELYKQGVNPKTTPGLFRFGGKMDLDNLDIDSMPEGLRFGGGDGTGFYASKQEIIDGIVGELRGDAVRTGAQQEAADMAGSYASDAARLRAEKAAINRQIGARASAPSAPAAPGDPVPMTTFRDVDTIKRAFDEVNRTNNGTGLMGGQSEVGRLAGDRARRIRDSLVSMSEDYRKALETSSDTIRRVEAVKLGGKMLGPSMTREDVAMALDGMMPGEKSAMRQGLRQFVDDTIARVKAIPGSPNADPQEALKAFGVLSSQDARQKVAALLGDSYAETVFKEMDRLGSALWLRQSIAKGSQTAPRGVAREVFNNAVDPPAWRRGDVVGAAKDAASTAMGASKTAVNRLRADARAEFADILTRGGSAAEIMDLMQRIGSSNAIGPIAGQGSYNALMASGLSTVPATTDRVRNLLAPR